MRTKPRRNANFSHSCSRLSLAITAVISVSCASSIAHAANEEATLAAPPANAVQVKREDLSQPTQPAKRKDTSVEPLEDADGLGGNACPTNPTPPPPPTLEEQMAVVDAFVESRFMVRQARAYPEAPHLDPLSVANAMISGAYNKDFTFVIAHRGEHTEPGYAENGLSGIWKAYTAGSDGVEIDIKTDCQGYTMLGHDFAIGRETVTPTFDTFANFPVTDPIYTDESKWPFRTNNTTNDPNNPNRLSNYIATYWNRPLKDQLDAPSPYSDGQITAFQAMYYIAKYTPMMVWLDVKNAQDVFSSAKEVDQARAAVGSTNTTLNFIGLKLGASTLRDPSIAYNPSNATGTKNLLYYAVIGLGDLDRVKADGGGDLASGLALYCNRLNGCLGIEIAHKYDGAPTQPVIDYINNTDLLTAGFHTVPQYDWNSFVEQDDPTKSASYVRNFNRTFPRTDGSCCFALEDSLNQGLGQAELLDRRGSYNWNQLTFNAITSDDATNLIRSLATSGKRPQAILSALGWKQTVPQVTFEDKIYAIYSITDNCFISTPDSSGRLRCKEGRSINSRSFLWSVTARQWDTYKTAQMTSIVDQSVWALNLDNPAYVNGVGPLIYSENLDYGFGFSLGSSTQISSSTGRQLFILQGFVSAKSGTGSSFVFIPIRQALLENPLMQGQVENRVGPPGSNLWCDQGQICGRGHVLQAGVSAEIIYFGVKDRYVQKTLPVQPEPFLCDVSTFGTDPAPGQSKACFRQLVVRDKLPGQYQAVPEGGTLPAHASVAYGTFDPNFQFYGNFGSSDMMPGAVCQNFPGAPDPYVGAKKSCYVILGWESIDGFGLCGIFDDDISQNCSFTTPHSVRLGYTGSDSVRRFTYKTFLNGARCKPDEFGVLDFNSDFVSCEARVVSQNEPQLQNYSFCAAVGQNCITNNKYVISSSTDRFLAAYADKVGNIYYAQLQGNFKCSLETFGQTGTPDPSAACFYRLY